MTRVSWKEQWSDWADPSPIAKYTSAGFAFVICVILVLNIPAIGVYHWPWFYGAIAVETIALVLAFGLSGWKELWRFELVVPSLSLLSVAMLRLGTNSDNSPIVFLAVAPVLWFAGMPGARYVGYGALGSLFALAVPVLLEDHTVDMVLQLSIALFATLVFTMMGFIFNGFAGGLRERSKALGEVAELRDDLLQESLRYSQQLEKSEFERGSAERMLRGVWEAVTEQAVIGTDLRGRVDAWNPGAEKMLGWTERDARDTLSIVDLHDPQELEERGRDAVDERHGALDPGFTALTESARAGKPEIRDWTYVRADGSRLPVQVSITRRLGIDGETVGYLFVANDMTELREVAKLKDEFVGLISHELRTPLSSILGYLELMRDEGEAGLSANQLQYLGVAERNANRLLRLVGDLLFTAQVESGTFQLDRQEIELAPILGASLESVRPVAIAAGITVSGNVDESIRVKGDALRLGQSIDNLVSNAIKFTPRGGSVTVSLAQSGAECTITVKDTGMGIAAAELDKLFSRFFRASTATRAAVPGVGLGLAITKAIIVAHDGTMQVESEEGVGTCFSISLPLAPERQPVG